MLLRLFTNRCLPQWRPTSTSQLNAVLSQRSISNIATKKIKGVPLLLKNCNAFQLNQQRSLPSWQELLRRLAYSLGIGRVLNYILMEWVPPLRQRRRYKQVLYGSLLIVLGFYTFAHVEKAPITGRMRFVIISKKEAVDHANNVATEFREQLTLVHPVEPIYQLAFTVLQELILKNREDLTNVKDVGWRLYICEDDRIWANSLVNGHIHITTGMLNSAGNVDEIAFLLAHEMSHILLEHGREKQSTLHFLYALYLTMAATFCAIRPFHEGLIASIAFIPIERFLLYLPLSRKCELEADRLGVELIARACYDITAGSRYFKKHLDTIKRQETAKRWTFMRTHPPTEERVAKLEELTPQMQQVQRAQGCSVVKVVDPIKQAKDRQ